MLILFTARCIIKNMIKAEYEKIFKDQLCVDFGLCSDGFNNGVTFAESKPFDISARAQFKDKPFFNLTYFDGRLLVVADKAFMPFAHDYVRGVTDLFRVFDAPNVFRLEAELNKYGYAVGSTVVGMLPKDGCDGVPTPDNCQVFYGREIEPLYREQTFKNAFCYSTENKPRDEIAVACFDGDMLIAAAACTNDGERMWQIGVDVKSEYRRRGIGAGIVAALKREIIKREVCPYYCHAYSNIASDRLAHAAGFEQYFVELSAVSLQDEGRREILSKITDK